MHPREPATGLALEANEFRVIHGKQGYHSHVCTANIPMLAQITKDYDTNRIWMNAEVRIMVTERIHPDMLFAPAG